MSWPCCVYMGSCGFQLRCMTNGVESLGPREHAGYSKAISEPLHALNRDAQPIAITTGTVVLRCSLA